MDVPYVDVPYVDAPYVDVPDVDDLGVNVRDVDVRDVYELQGLSPGFSSKNLLIAYEDWLESFVEV